jgi:hypothetical protein
MRLDGAPPERQPSTTVLGDWYANVVPLPFRGKSVVMCVNQPTRLAVLMPGRGTIKMLPVFRKRVIALLKKIDLSAECIGKEAREMADLQVSVTDSRSVLGSMNDMTRHLRAVAEQKSSAEAIDWDAQEMLFAEYMHGPLDYVPPKEVATRLFQAAT